MKQLELKRISDEDIKQYLIKEGYPPYSDMRFAGLIGADAQLQDDQQVLDNVKQAILDDLIEELEKSKMCCGWITIKRQALEIIKKKWLK